MGLQLNANQLKSVSDHLSADTGVLSDLAADPKRVLSSLGVEIDDATAVRLAAKLSDRGTADIAQAAIVHIDA
jgi:ribosomal protein L12E/L44/L45/RPP1/RPP2